MVMPLRGLRTSMTEPSAAVRTMLPLAVRVSLLPGGPGLPRKVRDCTRFAVARALSSEATCRSPAVLRGLPAGSAVLRLLPAAAAAASAARRCAAAAAAAATGLGGGCACAGFAGAACGRGEGEHAARAAGGMALPLL